MYVGPSCHGKAQSALTRDYKQLLACVMVTGEREYLLWLRCVLCRD